MRILNKNSNGGRVVVTTDGGAGSSGKGCLNSWLADQHVFHVATNNWMPNAGHITELNDGTRITVQHIPSAFIDKDTELYLNAGAALDLKILFDEIEMLEDLGFPIKRRLTIHPNANVITQEDRERERVLIKSGSTFKGCGAALAGKTLRQGRKLAKDYEELAPFIRDRTLELNEKIAKGIRVLVEGSQGVDLDINHAQFPFCTSRQTHPTQLLADAGLPVNCVTNIIVNIRTNPIRISNVSAADGTNCYSGDYWEAKELKWEDVAIQAGWENPEDFIEHYGFAMRTTVTKKVRRVFEFPVERMKFIHAMCGGLFDDNILLYSLNFVNFVDKNVEGVTTYEELMTPKVREWLDTNLYPVIGPDKLKWVRTGPKHSQIVEIEESKDQLKSNEV